MKTDTDDEIKAALRMLVSNFDGVIILGARGSSCVVFLNQGEETVPAKWKVTFPTKCEPGGPMRRVRIDAGWTDRQWRERAAIDKPLPMGGIGCDCSAAQGERHAADCRSRTSAWRDRRPVREWTLVRELNGWEYGKGWMVWQPPVEQAERFEIVRVREISGHRPEVTEMQPDHPAATQHPNPVLVGVFGAEGKLLRVAPVAEPFELSTLGPGEHARAITEKDVIERWPNDVTVIDADEFAAALRDPAVIAFQREAATYMADLRARGRAGLGFGPAAVRLTPRELDNVARELIDASEACRDESGIFLDDGLAAMNKTKSVLAHYFPERIGDG